MFGHYHHPPAWREYICGLYFNVPCNGRLHKTYLPQVDLQAHATILSTTSRTNLKQTFVNPSSEKGIREVRYTFPLYDGVSVVSFKCHVGDRTIVGEVKEKEKARAVFKEAVARGETAGLLEQLPEASDVFSTTVGNIPPGTKVVVEITYLGELKHDMEVDGIRYTIPNIICPRYGAYSGDIRTSSATEAVGTGISITVDAEMADGSFIKKIQSPSHPISMTMGTLSNAPDADPIMTRASAALTLGEAQLDTDFVIQVIAKNAGVPKAILETHPTIPNQRALMATLVPKFALPPEKPELVFVCDRSGSMGGTRITLVIQALKVFLKSLPVGVKFNICSFGSSYSFLWPKSVTYSQKTLDEAIKHAETFTANHGGTEMLNPLKATIEQRYKDLPLDVMLLTDGEIWNQQQLFSYLNEAISQSKAPIRLFTLGIGNGVSHALIEGVAKAGDGFSQTVGEGEKMDTKVVRMLKGALSPHIKDYTLEVKYSKDVSNTDDDDDFVEVERVADSLKVTLNIEEDKKPSIKQKVISLFDNSADPDKDEPPVYDETGESRYSHLPTLPIPKILQAPQNIPSLFAFNRTTAYLLLGPEAARATPTAVVLRGTSSHGLLELEIPVEVLDRPGETIHQLAAKKAISELEQGRGWLSQAKDESGKLVKSQVPGKFDDMVEREAVRLGVQFQVGGKWCSFVAVEKPSTTADTKDKSSNDWEWLEEEIPGTDTNRESTTISYTSALPSKYTFDSDSESDDDMGFGLFDGDSITIAAEEEEEEEEEELDEAALEAEIEENIDSIQATAQRLHKLAQDMSEEVEEQNRMLQCIPCGSGCCTNLFAENPPGYNPTRLARLRSAPSGPPAPATRTAKLQSDIDATVAVMQDNISSVITRGEKLDDLQPRSSALSYSAQAFRQSAEKPKSYGLFGMFGGSKSSSNSPSPFANLPQPQQKSGGLFGGGSFFGSSPAPAPPPPAPANFGAPLSQSAALFGGSANQASATNTGGGLFGMASAGGRGGFGGSAFSSRSSAPAAPAQPAFGAAPQIQQQVSPSFGAPAPSASLAPPGNYGSSSAAKAYIDSGAATPYDLGSPSYPATTAFGSASFQPMSYDPTIEDSDRAFKPISPAYQPTPSIPQTNSTATFSPTSPQYSPASPGTLHNPFKSFVSGDKEKKKKKTSESSAPVSSRKTASFFGSSASNAAPPPPATAEKPVPTIATPEELTHFLISLQTFEGYWDVLPSLLSSLKISEADITSLSEKLGVRVNVLMTALVVAVLEQKLREFEGSWELVVDKARDWLGGEYKGDVDELVNKAGGLVI